MPKEVTAKTEWQATHVFEVPDDWEWDGELASLVEYDELNTDTAELLNWYVVTVKTLEDRKV